MTGKSTLIRRHPARSDRDFVYNPPTAPLDILYQDDEILAVNKPSGLLSVPGKDAAHKDCLEARIQAHCPAARIVHRLDMATSGVMVLALTPAAHRHLGLQFERRHTVKTYLAQVWGDVQGNSGHIDLPLICDWPNRPMQMVSFEHGKPAQTDWEVLVRGGRSTRLLLHPKTGRSHQLRVHMLSLGYPILGDRLYAHDDAFAAMHRLALHAKTLQVFHPAGGRTMHFEASDPF